MLRRLHSQGQGQGKNKEPRANETAMPQPANRQRSNPFSKQTETRVEESRRRLKQNPWDLLYQSSSNAVDDAVHESDEELAFQGTYKSSSEDEHHESDLEEDQVLLDMDDAMEVENVDANHMPPVDTIPNVKKEKKRGLTVGAVVETPQPEKESIGSYIMMKSCTLLSTTSFDWITTGNISKTRPSIDGLQYYYYNHEAYSCKFDPFQLHTDMNEWRYVFESLFSQLEIQGSYFHWLHPAVNCLFIGHRLSESSQLEVQISGCPSSLSKWIKSKNDFQTMKTDPKIFTLSADSTLLHGGKLVPKFEYVAGHTLRIVGDTSCRDFFTFMMDHAHKLTLKSSFVGIALAPFQFVGGQLRQNKVSKNGLVSRHKAGQIFQSYNLTIDGPLLTSSTQDFINKLEVKQENLEIQFSGLTWDGKDITRSLSFRNHSWQK